MPDSSNEVIRILFNHRTLADISTCGTIRFFYEAWISTFSVVVLHFLLAIVYTLVPVTCNESGFICCLFCRLSAHKLPARSILSWPIQAGLPTVSNSFETNAVLLPFLAFRSKCSFCCRDTIVKPTIIRGIYLCCKKLSPRRLYLWTETRSVLQLIGLA